jgi:hypothetical protein
MAPVTHDDTWGHSCPSASDDNPTPDDFVLGLSREDLLDEFQSPFLPGDLILFRHRRWPNEDLPVLGHFATHPNRPARFCGYCILDLIGVCIFLGSIYLAISINRCFGSRRIPPTSWSERGLAAAAALFLCCHLPHYEVSPPHAHVIPWVADRTLYRGETERFEEMWVSIKEILDSWRSNPVPPETRPNEYCLTDPCHPFTPLSHPDTLQKLDKGYLILRLEEYPDVFPSPCLGCLNKAYRVYRDYQRIQAARQAYDEMQEEGDLEEDEPTAPTEYSISELERNGRAFGYLPVYRR